MKFTKKEFLELMHFPEAWNKLGMYTDEMFHEHVAHYIPGHEAAPEHDRNGAFHWWLKRTPTKSQLKKLVELSYLDPDQLMAEDIRKHIMKAEKYDNEIARLINQLNKQ